MDPSAAIGLAAGQMQNTKNTAHSYIGGWLNRRHSRKMYERQRKDALEFWHMQNEYNHPSAQMERLKSSGLNPHLVYGQGAGGATGQAATIDQPTTLGATQGTPATSSLPQDMLAGAQVSVRKAQTDNLKAQTQTEYRKGLLKLLEIDEKHLQNKWKRETWQKELERLNKLVENVGVQTEQTRAQTGLTLEKAETEAVMRSRNIQESIARVARIREQNAKSREERKQIQANVELIKSKLNLQKFEEGLNQMGVTKGDPLYQRMIANFLNTSGVTLSEAIGILTKNHADKSMIERMNPLDYVETVMKALDEVRKNKN